MQIYIEEMREPNLEAEIAFHWPNHVGQNDDVNGAINARLRN